MSAKHFAVIGAGAGGLAAARHLLAEGVEATIFEAGSRVGGLWVFENDSGRSPAYRSLHINSEARVSAFADFPFPPDGPLYPGTREMERYFQAYAERFDLLRRIRFGCEVEAIAPEGGRHRVSLKGGEGALFDGVVVATGHQSVPRHPPQAEGFAGEYLHAHAYRVPEPFAGKRVLVIGPGNSGVDIAADLCAVTDMTFLAARSPVLIMPRMMLGKPLPRVLMRLEKPWLPLRLRLWMRTALTRLVHGRMEQWGFRTPRTRTHPISHPTLISHIAWDRIRVKPGLERTDGRTVHFADGSREEVDCIVAATGYRTELPFLPAGTSPVEGTRMNLYQRIVHPGLPGVFFIGFFDVTGGSNIRMMDDQGAYIAAVAGGRLPLPDREAMEAAIQVEHAWQAGQFPDTPRYGLELDPRRYRKQLARAYRRAGLRPPV